MENPTWKGILWIWHLKGISWRSEDWKRKGRLKESTESGTQRRIDEALMSKKRRKFDQRRRIWSGKDN
jgi:hypothetical protein